jgi:hypothetical protein
LIIERVDEKEPLKDEIRGLKILLLVAVLFPTSFIVSVLLNNGIFLLLDIVATYFLIRNVFDHDTVNRMHSLRPILVEGEGIWLDPYPSYTRQYKKEQPDVFVPYVHIKKISVHWYHMSKKEGWQPWAITIITWGNGIFYQFRETGIITSTMESIEFHAKKKGLWETEVSQAPIPGRWNHEPK